MYLVLIHSVSIKITKPSKNLVLSFKRQSDQIKSKSFEVKRWSQDFGPFVKVDYLTRKTVLHDKEKESFSRV